MTASRPYRSYGILLAVGAVLLVAFVTHHPTGRGSSTAEWVDSVARIAHLARWVHGLLIGVVLLQLTGLTALSQRTGSNRLIGRAALVFYAFGCVVMVLAAVTSGFGVTDLVSGYASGGGAPAADPAELEMVHVITHFAHHLVAGLSHVGVMLWSVAVILWSLAHATMHGRFRATAVGVAGLVIGLLIPAAMFAGHLKMDVHGMIALCLGQAIWHVIVAIDLIRFEASS